MYLNTMITFWSQSLPFFEIFRVAVILTMQQQPHSQLMTKTIINYRAAQTPEKYQPISIHGLTW